MPGLICLFRFPSYFALLFLSFSCVTTIASAQEVIVVVEDPCGCDQALENALSDIEQLIIAELASLSEMFDAQRSAAGDAYTLVLVDPNSTDAQKEAALLIFQATIAAIDAAEIAAISAALSFHAVDIAAAYAAYALCELLCDPDNVPNPNPEPVPDPNP